MDVKASARIIFLLAAIYDFGLGVLFALFYPAIFSYLSIPSTNSPQYVVGGAVLIALFGVGFYFLYKNVDRNHDLYILGILFKLSYVLMAVYFYFIAKSLHPVFALFAIPDALILIPLILFYKKIYG
ncbi:MAG: hypothetical protein EPN86_05350 [Nanoarchaeota archaeon]|nr:MAG: hypothetical protein EPN86_05350 [Nanoarchaeota archaeon]